MLEIAFSNETADNLTEPLLRMRFAVFFIKTTRRLRMDPEGIWAGSLATAKRVFSGATDQGEFEPQQEINYLIDILRNHGYRRYQTATPRFPAESIHHDFSILRDSNHF